MQTIRTTISLPKDVHQEIRRQAFEENKSLSEVVVERLGQKPKKHLVIRPFKVGVIGSLRRQDMYEEVLTHRVKRDN